MQLRKKWRPKSAKRCQKGPPKHNPLLLWGGPGTDIFPESVPIDFSVANYTINRSVNSNLDFRGKRLHQSLNIAAEMKEGQAFLLKKSTVAEGKLEHTVIHDSSLFAVGFIA